MNSVLVAALLFASEGVAAQPPAMAVVVSAPTLEANEEFAVETSLTSAVESLATVDLVPRTEVRYQLQGARALNAECKWEDKECLTAFAGALHAQRVLFVEYSPPHVMASLTEVGVSPHFETFRTVAPDGFSDATASRVALALLEPTKAGSLVVMVEPTDATVSVDGERVIPGTRVDGLAVGGHELEVTGDGFAPHREEVIITAGGLLPHDVKLEPAPVTSELSPILLGGLGALGAGVIAGAAGIALAVTPALLPPSEQRDARQHQARDGTLLASGLVAGGLGVLAVATGVGLSAYSFVE